jgi:glycerate kinase
LDLNNMKIVIAPDSFKGSLDAVSVAVCIEKGFRDIFPAAEYVTFPLADGGEGTVDVLLQGLFGEKIFSGVKGPLGNPVNAMWAMLERSDINTKKTALIEISAASGLDLLSVEERNPLSASTFGTGQLILEAINQGAETIIIGLGGSATNDGGAGIVQALGGKLKTKENQEIKQGGLALSELASIDLSELEPRCKEIEFIVACDVVNPLCGERGASHVFGPQKGASRTDVVALDDALQQFAEIAQNHGYPNHQNSESFGAAGGSPLGLSLVFDIQIKSGIEMVLDILKADEVLKGADLVITGEGQMDNQTLQGKTPYGIAKRAGLQGIPSIGIAGSLGENIDELYGQMSCIFGAVRSPQPLHQVLSEAELNLTRTARNIAATLKLGAKIAL